MMNSDALIIESTKDRSDFIIVDVPFWLAEYLGKPVEILLGHSVESSLGELGVVIVHVAQELLASDFRSQEHTAEFTEKSGKQFIVGIIAAKTTVSAPVTGTSKTESKIHIHLSLDIQEKTSKLNLRYFGPGIFQGIIGISSSMQNLFLKIRKYAPTPAPVVITGETGTGKELIARALHNVSLRNPGPFVAINCTALNEELFESELFGHEKGSFTGAIREHRGRFERADKGTLFLDEIGDMPPRSQAKMLRVLETNSFERVGGEREIRADVRVIAATNISLELAVSRGQFRADLYHRLAVLKIHVPPLRERIEDIPLLANHFLKLLNGRYRKNIIRVSPDAMRLLEEYHWPGNIRELRNVIERVYVETQGTIIGRNAFKEWEQERDLFPAGQWDLQHYEQQQFSRKPIVPPMSRFSDTGKVFYPLDLIHHAQMLPPALPAGKIISDIRSETGKVPANNGSSKFKTQITERSLIDLYHKTSGNITEMARQLNIHKATLYRLLKKLNLTRANLSGKESPPSES